eukprot:m.96193 g.96193  ORF g.96193 m.96193 type:complete len:722 (-) comp13067_c0_seq1:92-2257(-)
MAQRSPKHSRQNLDTLPALVEAADDEYPTSQQSDTESTTDDEDMEQRLWGFRDDFGNSSLTWVLAALETLNDFLPQSTEEAHHQTSFANFTSLDEVLALPPRLRLSLCLQQIQRIYEHLKDEKSFMRDELQHLIDTNQVDDAVMQWVQTTYADSAELRRRSTQVDSAFGFQAPGSENPVGQIQRRLSLSSSSLPASMLSEWEDADQLERPSSRRSRRPSLDQMFEFSPVPSPTTSKTSLDPLLRQKGETIRKSYTAYHMVDQAQAKGAIDEIPQVLRLKQPLVTQRTDLYKPSQECQELLSTCSGSWSFDIFALDSVSGFRPLVAMGLHLLDDSGLIHTLRLDKVQMSRFLATIENLYGRYPQTKYHNNLHGADVAHSTFILLQNPAFQGVFTPLEMLAAIVAAICHDVNHPGKTNQFLNSTLDPLSLLYNDQSTLEMHHCATTFHIMNQPRCDFTTHMSNSDKKILRELIIQMILSTDMTKHFKFVQDFRSTIERLLSGAAVVEASTSPSSPSLTKPDTAPKTAEGTRLKSALKRKVSLEHFDHLRGLSSQDKSIVLQAAVHCADLAGPTKEWTISKQWSGRILDEFFAQGDEEKKRNLPVGPLNDRDTVKVPKSQMGFIDFAVLPLWECWGILIRDPEYEPMMNLIQNRNSWEMQQAKDEGQVVSSEQSRKQLSFQKRSLRRRAKSVYVALGMKHRLSTASASTDPDPDEGSPESATRA